MDRKPKLTVTKLPRHNLIVLRQDKDANFFISSTDSFIIDLANFSWLLAYFVQNGIISPKLLEGILEEYYTNKP